MKILVTGSEGFIGKNLRLSLVQQKYEVLCFDKHTIVPLKDLVHQADFIMHLAGVNRPINSADFYIGNSDLTKQLLTYVEDEKRDIPILITSSIHAESDSDYGKSKRMAEDEMFSYSRRTGNSVFVFRLANAFGKWSRPNYNSVIATFCYNIAHNLPIQIHNPDVEIPFVYIDDIVNCLIKCIGQKGNLDYLYVTPIHNVKIGEVARLIQSFKESRENFFIPYMEKDSFAKKLYSTYLSYLSKDDFLYPLLMHTDQRGSFTEFIKTLDFGQVSVNIAHPNIVKGNHWHHTKNEKFLVVSGEGVIRFRKIDETDVIEYHVSGKKLEVIDVPCGYTHNIENTGTEDMVTIMWANEILDQEKPDTFYEVV